MAGFLEAVLDSFGNLSVGGTSLYTLADVGVVLAVGVAVFFAGKWLYEKLTNK